MIITESARKEYEKIHNDFLNEYNNRTCEYPNKLVDLDLPPEWMILLQIIAKQQDEINKMMSAMSKNIDDGR